MRYFSAYFYANYVFLFKRCHRCCLYVVLEIITAFYDVIVYISLLSIIVDFKISSLIFLYIVYILLDLLCSLTLTVFEGFIIGMMYFKSIFDYSIVLHRSLPMSVAKRVFMLVPVVEKYVDSSEVVIIDSRYYLVVY